MKLAACLLALLPAVAVSAQAAGGDVGALGKRSQQQLARDYPEQTLFPVMEPSTSPGPDGGEGRERFRAGLFEYPGGDAAPTCVNPPPR